MADIECHVAFVYWNALRGAYVGLPAGIPVEVIDRNVLADRVLARGVLDDEGYVHLRLDPDHERGPDLYFRYRIPDDAPAAIDLATNTLAASGFPIPRAWETRSRYALEDPARPGYWGALAGYRIGAPHRPYVFDVLEEAPRLRPGNLARPLIDGVETGCRLEALLEAAEKSIHVEVMLYFNDPIGRRITDLLIRKARQGVEVRLMFDVRTTADSYRLYTLRRVWVGGLINLPDEERAAQLAEAEAAEQAEKLRGDTAEIRAALAATPGVRFLDTSFPYVQIRPRAPAGAPPAYQELTASLPFFTVARIDHRKLIVVDGKAAILGGHNIGEEYLYDVPFDPLREASEEEWVKWHDVMIEIQGPAVRDAQSLFRERWVEEGGDAFDLGPRALGVGTDPRHPYFPRLEERRTQKAGTLSGGEQQMCAIGRAMMARPRLLMLDEQSMGLAPIFVDRIFETIVAINQEGTPILLVEQNALMALDVASRGYVMQTGRIVLQGPASELKTNEQVRKTYLGEG